MYKVSKETDDQLAKFSQSFMDRASEFLKKHEGAINSGKDKAVEFLKTPGGHAAAGAGLGALALGGHRLFTPSDEEEGKARGVINQALLGAILGGGVAASPHIFKELTKAPEGGSGDASADGFDVKAYLPGTTRAGRVTGAAAAAGLGIRDLARYKGLEQQIREVANGTGRLSEQAAKDLKKFHDAVNAPVVKSVRNSKSTWQSVKDILNKSKKAKGSISLYDTARSARTGPPTVSPVTVTSDPSMYRRFIRGIKNRKILSKSIARPNRNWFSTLQSPAIALAAAYAADQVAKSVVANRDKIKI
jgi:hypothetical protein